jgi:CDP-diacylglycerol--glycerol-3-phosphate 3-phosphatidyltransferase
MTGTTAAGADGARGLYAAKAWYTRRLAGFVQLAVRREISPDVFTVVGIVGGLAAAAFLAAGAAWPSVWWGLAITVALAVRLGGANLDGAVARARGLSRPWGFVLNEVGDRVSDLAAMIVLAGIAGGWWGLIGLAGSCLPTLASLALAGAGGPRLNGGPVGKTERCAVLVLVTLLAPWWELYVAAAAMIGVGGLLTAALRLRTGRAMMPAVVGPVAGDGR